MEGFQKWVAIFRLYDDNAVYDHVALQMDEATLEFSNSIPLFRYNEDIFIEIRFATEEEKQKLFDAIKDNGYKWNAETKTLEKIVVPEFEDGDILTSNAGSIFILKTKNIGKNETFYNSYVALDCVKEFYENCVFSCDKNGCRLATAEEKQKLFDAIKENGYKWNAETKTLERLNEPKFKVGDKILKNGDTIVTTIKDIRDNDYVITFPDSFGHAHITDILPFSNQNDWELFNPKFKVGDKIKLKKSTRNIISTVTKINDDGSISINGYELIIKPELQDKFELVTDKFDISTLKPFDKVLGRTVDTGIWECDLFSCYNDSEVYNNFHCIGVNYRYCIPYEGNEHLLGTTDDCDEYFKTWEE